MNKTILLICLLILTLQTFPQEKVKAIKFDEYNEKEKVDLKLLEEKAKQFSNKLGEESKKSQGLIFIYHPLSIGERTCKPFLVISNYFAPRNEVLERDLDSQKQNIVRKAGGFRDFFALEFWIIPEGAENPEPTPDYEDVDFGVCCPSITINSDSTNLKNKVVVFTAELSGGNSSDEEPVFQWKTSAGEIISGQGTKQIEVNISKVNSEEITVTVELEKGLSASCQRFVSSNVSIQSAKPK